MCLKSVCVNNMCLKEPNLLCLLYFFERFVRKENVL